MTVQSTAKYAINVALGTGDLVVEKAKGVAGNLRRFEPKAFWSGYGKQLFRTYDDLAGRGEKLRKTIVRSAPAKRAAAQSKVARSQVKAAATSVRKAFGETAGAARSVAKTTAKRAG
jgi:hypothetical protein